MRVTLVLNLTSLSEHLLKAKVPHKVIPRDARFPHIKLGLLGFHKSSWVYWVLQTDHKAPWHLSSASPDYKMLALDNYESSQGSIQSLHNAAYLTSLEDCANYLTEQPICPLTLSFEQ